MSGARKDNNRDNNNRRREDNNQSRRDDQNKKRDGGNDRRSGGGGGGNRNSSGGGGSHRQERNGGGSGGGGGGRGHHQDGGFNNEGNFGRGGGGGRQGAPFSGAPLSESQLMDEMPKKKFTGRCRLFVGNLPNETKEAELKELFTPHGDIAECYLSGKGFAFLRLDTRAHAESAKEAIDGRVIGGRQIRVRFAVHGAAIRVKELSPTVSNEMLYHAFSHFGEVERAVHIVDEKGRPTGEGIIEFERKPNCNEAMAAIREKVFLMTASPKPLVCEVLDPKDEDDGLAERMIPRTMQLSKERELGPRFPAANTFEFVYGMKWKELYEIEKKRREQLEEDLKESRRRLEADMELAYQDYQAQMLREDLQRRQQELDRLEAARRERMRGLGGPPPMGGGMGHQPFGNGPQNSFLNGPPPSMGGGPSPFGQGFGGPQGMFGGGGPPPHQQHPQQVPPLMQQNVPPSQQQQQGGGPPNGGSGGAGNGAGQGGGGPGGRTNMIEGVQRLLQIFKSEPGAQNSLLSRDFNMPPPSNSATSGMFNTPKYGGGGGGDFPPEKKLRR